MQVQLWSDHHKKSSSMARLTLPPSVEALSCHCGSLWQIAGDADGACGHHAESALSTFGAC